MTKLSLIDKLGVLFEVISSSKIHILIFLVLLFIGYTLTSTNRKKANKMKRVFFLIYMLVLGIIIYTYRDNLGNIFDYMMSNLFVVIYFPNLAIYLAAIIITNIIMWTSVLNSKISRIIRNINVTFYCLITYLLVLILNIIKENKLDVFIQSSVYSNKYAHALIELSSIIFIIWILFLLVYKLIKPFFVEKDQLEVVEQKVQANEKKITTPVMSVNSKIETTFPKRVEVGKNYRQIEAPRMVFGNIRTKKEKVFNNIEVPEFVMGNNIRKPKAVFNNIEVPEFVMGNNIKRPKEVFNKGNSTANNVKKQEETFESELLRMISGDNFTRDEKIYANVEAPRIVFGNNKIKDTATAGVCYRKIEPPSVVRVSKLSKTTEESRQLEKAVEENKQLARTLEENKQLSRALDDLLTLDDYKLLLSVLKEQKEKVQQIKERQAKVDREKAKFNELQQLYTGVR